MLTQGDLVPHVELQTLDGRRFRYSDIWQQRNLVLVAVPPEPSASAERYASDLMARAGELAEQQTDCVITRDRVPGLRAPGVVVADRWGEIVYVSAAGDAADLPPAEELVDWIVHVQTRCPECEGEAK
jgi:hypothetical protein